MTAERLAGASPIELSAATREFEHGEAIVVAGRGRSLMVAMIAGALLAAISWRFLGVPGACRPHDLDMAGRSTVESLAYRIVTAESGGDVAAKNELSSATGAGQFLDATWLDVIRTARPELVGQSDEDILNLRRDPDLSREMVARFAKRNAAVLASRCLPVTPGTLYLSHSRGARVRRRGCSLRHSPAGPPRLARRDPPGRRGAEQIATAKPAAPGFRA